MFVRFLTNTASLISHFSNRVSLSILYIQWRAYILPPKKYPLAEPIVRQRKMGRRCNRWMLLTVFWICRRALRLDPLSDVTSCSRTAPTVSLPHQQQSQVTGSPPPITIKSASRYGGRPLGRRQGKRWVAVCFCFHVVLPDSNTCELNK